MIEPDLLALLREVDSPTVCNTLIYMDPSLRGRNYTFAPVVAANPGLAPMVGFARTARIVSSMPSTDSPEVIRQRRFDYYEYVSSGAQPTIVVMQDCGPQPGYGCIWGELNVAIHKGLGVTGAVTNGAIRDLGTLDSTFPLLGGNVCPGSGFAHITEFDTDVTVFGLAVSPGDLIHADQHGAVVIPPHVLPELAGALRFILQREAILLDAAKAPGFDYAALRKAWEKFEAFKK